MHLRGRYKIEQRGRSPFPEREFLRYECERSVFYICRGPNDCLRMYTEREWDNVVKGATSPNQSPEEALDNNRLLFSAVEKVAVDGQGRILLPGYLKNIAGISKDVMIVGMITFIELWDKKKWDDFESEKGPHFTWITPKPSGGPSPTSQTPS